MVRRIRTNPLGTLGVLLDADQGAAVTYLSDTVQPVVDLTDTFARDWQPKSPATDADLFMPNHFSVTSSIADAVTLFEVPAGCKLRLNHLSLLINAGTRTLSDVRAVATAAGTLRGLTLMWSGFPSMPPARYVVAYGMIWDGLLYLTAGHKVQAQWQGGSSDGSWYCSWNGLVSRI